MEEVSNIFYFCGFNLDNDLNEEINIDYQFFSYFLVQLCFGWSLKTRFARFKPVWL